MLQVTKAHPNWLFMLIGSYTAESQGQGGQLTPTFTSGVNIDF